MNAWERQAKEAGVLATEPSNVPSSSPAREASYAEAIEAGMPHCFGGCMAEEDMPQVVARAVIALADAELAPLVARVAELEAAVALSKKWIGMGILRSMTGTVTAGCGEELRDALAAAGPAVSDGCVCPPDFCLGAESDQGPGTTECGPCLALDPELPCPREAVSDGEGATSEPVSHMSRDFSLWLNGTYPAGLSEEAVLHRRVGKIHEEAGEVRTALGAYLHENPRKPAGPIEDVIKELADCVGAALGAIEHLTGHGGRSLDIATDRIRFVCERVGVRPASPVVAPSTTDEGGA